MAEETLEGELKRTYLDKIRGYEAGEDVGIFEVLKATFGFCFEKPREYFQTLVEERLKRR